MKKVKSIKKSGSILLKIALGIFVVYVLVMLISLQTQIRDKKQERSDVQESIVRLQAENNEIREELDGEDEAYIEKIARERLNYAKPGDRVFVNITGE